MKITVSMKGCIHCNVVGKNPRSSDYVLKDGLEMFIEGGIRNISRGGKWIRSAGWGRHLGRDKNRFCIWGTWVERWFGQELEVTKAI